MPYEVLSYSNQARWQSIPTRRSWKNYLGLLLPSTVAPFSLFLVLDLKSKKPSLGSSLPSPCHRAQRRRWGLQKLPMRPWSPHDALPLSISLSFDLKLKPQKPKRYFGRNAAICDGKPSIGAAIHRLREVFGLLAPDVAILRQRRHPSLWSLCMWTNQPKNPSLSLETVQFIPQAKFFS